MAALPSPSHPLPPPGSGNGVKPPSPFSIIAIIAGTILALLGIGAIMLGGAAASAVGREGENRYLQSPVRSFATDSYALVSPTLELVIDETALARTPFDLGQVRLQAEPVTPDQDIFIGVGERADVEGYLGDVSHAEIVSVRSFPSSVRYEDKPGSSTPADPAGETFWIASAHGQDLQDLVVPVHSGEWVVVVMNADASPGGATSVRAGYSSDQIGVLPAVVITGGILVFLLGAGMIWLGVAHAGKNLHPARQTINHDERDRTRFHGRLDGNLSRGLWLVKWLLAIPHVVILGFLWVAFAITTVIAGVAILVTGKYPRSLFDFNVGVLRWNWRVGYYAHSALATDRYPPFTLASTAYPADLHVAYPDHLSRGLVLVKGWLLALPHLLIIAVFTGFGTGWPGQVLWSGQSAWYERIVAGTAGGEPGPGYSLLGILVLLAGLLLLFTGVYRQGLFNLIMGINRWVFRVTIYVALMSDKYPPFTLDQGSDEPAETPVRPQSVPELS